jgi:hypothetical protein
MKDMKKCGRKPKDSFPLRPSTAGEKLSSFFSMLFFMSFAFFMVNNVWVLKPVFHEGHEEERRFSFNIMFSWFIYLPVFAI